MLRLVFMIHQVPSVWDTISVLISDNEAHTIMSSPGMGTVFAPCLSVTSPGHLIRSSHLLMSNMRTYTGTWYTSLPVSWYSFYVLRFIVLWLDYYFVFPVWLAGCELPSKGMKSQAASRSHGTFHLLNLHQNIQQKPPNTQTPSPATYSWVNIL